MPTLDFTTCTMDDVIARSLVMHPSLLIDAIRDQQDMHRNYLVNASHKPSVQASINACTEALDVLDAPGFPQWAEEIPRALKEGLTFGARIIVFNVACKLQLIPAHTRTAIAVREDERKA